MSSKITKQLLWLALTDKIHLTRQDASGFELEIPDFRIN